MMRRIGWIIGGYLLAVIAVAVLFVAAMVAFGPPIAKNNLEASDLFMKALLGGLVALAPVYVGARAFLFLFSMKAAFSFALVFMILNLLLFSGLAQVLEIWLLEWDHGISTPQDFTALIRDERMAALFWGGFAIGPFFFTGLGVAFWCLAGACFGLVIWWSERMSRVSIARTQDGLRA